VSGKHDPLPGSGVRAFEIFVRVRFHETDALGHVNNAAYLNYLEQAAIDHATYVGIDLNRLQSLGGMFVARRHDITFLRPAFAGDTLRIMTWLDPPSGARIVRNYRILREIAPPNDLPTVGRFAAEIVEESAQDLVVRAITEWVFTSGQGAPRRIPVEIEDLFASHVPE
jgi:YbgC/YbaW family acyl-CoA thioester hydrolase